MRLFGRPAAPPRSQELIFLDVDDDLGTIRAKLESSPADDVFLVVPRRATTLRTPLEFRILARMAHELSTDVTIVSPETGRRLLARQEGLRVRRGYSGVRHLAEAAGAPKRWYSGLPDWLPLPSLTAIFVIGLLGALAGGFMLVVLPVMRVTMTPTSENVQREIEVLVDANERRSDIARGILPGEVLQTRFEVSGSVPATGEKNIGNDPARGDVLFTNTTASPIVLPARSVIVARNGTRFLTESDVRIGAYSYGLARASVTAEQKGTVGNVEPDQMASVDPPIQGLTVTNPRPMTGGTDRPGRVVTATDHAKLREQLMTRAREQAMSEFSAQVGSAKSAPADSLQLRVEGETFQPAVDAEGEQHTGTVRISASILAWSNHDMNTLVQSMLLSKFGPQYDLPLTQLRMPPPEVVEAQPASGSQPPKLRVKLKADALVVHMLDAQDIAEQLRGKSSDEARSMLQRVPGVTGSPRIEITPGWAPRAYRVEVAVATPK